MNQNGNAAVKLVDLGSPKIDESSQGPEFGDGDDGDPTLSEVNIDIAENGFLVSFVNEFHDCEKKIFTNKEELLKELGKRLWKL